WARALQCLSPGARLGVAAANQTGGWLAVGVGYQHLPHTHNSLDRGVEQFDLVVGRQTRTNRRKHESAPAAWRPMDTAARRCTRRELHPTADGAEPPGLTCNRPMEPSVCTIRTVPRQPGSTTSARLEGLRRSRH